MPAPRVVALPAPVAAAVALEAMGPLNFDLLEGDRIGWTFAVAQPGPINVEVQSQGAPVIVSAQRAGGKPIEQAGAGTIALNLEATANDIGQSVLWSVSVRDANAQAPAAAGTSKRVLRPIARGSVTVRHPPGDPQRADAELRRAAASLSAQKAQFTASPAQSQARLSQLLAADAATAAQRPPPPPPPPVVVNTMMARTSPQGLKMQGGVRAPLLRPGMTLDVQPAISSVVAAANRSSVTTAGAAIEISGVRFGPGNGEPFQTGTNYNEKTGKETPIYNYPSGKVLIETAAGVRIEAPRVNAASWSDSKITVQMPWMGVGRETVKVYVLTLDTPTAPGMLSGAMTMQYDPPIGDYWLLGYPDTGLPSDPWVMNTNLGSPTTTSPGALTHAGDLLVGFRGDDEFSLSAPLKNGWVVVGCSMFNWAEIGLSSTANSNWAQSYPTRYDMSGDWGYPWLLLIPGNNIGSAPYISTNIFGGGANATITECSQGTANVYTKVHWWTEAGASVSYNVGVHIRGPIGVPFR